MTRQASLLVERDGGWVRFTLSAPAKRNTLSRDMTAELRAALKAVEDDPRVRGISVRAEGGVFCAGADLAELTALVELPARERFEAAEALSLDAASLFLEVRHARVPTIAIVEGAATGGGVGLACACDYVLAGPEARFALSETRVGLTPAQIGPCVVERLGPVRARQLMMTGVALSGVEAARIGLADAAEATSEALAARESAIVEAVVACAPAAVAASKALAAEAGLAHGEVYARNAARGFAERLSSEEGKEGIAAFLSKRPPAWIRPSIEGGAS